MTIKLTIHNEDCVKGMAKLPENSVDVIVTSPPYNIGTKYKSYKDDRDLATYLLWTAKWLSEAYRVLKPEGSLFLNLGGKPTMPLIPYQILDMAIKGNYVLQNTIHWIKSIYVGKTHGHYKPINSPRFINDCHEFVFHLTKAGNVKLDRLAVGVPFTYKENISRWSGKEDLHCRGNTWHIPYKTIQRKKTDRPHPATFPVELAVNCLKLHGIGEISMVLDPFNGLGTTGVACDSLGINYTGFELDEEYAIYTKNRFTLLEQVF